MGQNVTDKTVYPPVARYPFNFSFDVEKLESLTDLWQDIQVPPGLTEWLEPTVSEFANDSQRNRSLHAIT